jgi:hypothetical protein
MIVKSISKKGVCFGKLLAYIGTPEKTEARALETGTILHNLKTPNADPATMEREFLDNHRYMRARRNGVVCFHEILSLKEPHPKATQILEDLGQVYLSIRAPNALAYARIHTETDHPHLHLLISGNEIESSKKIRISKKRFTIVKQKLERYQERHYPFLSHSLVHGRTKPKKELTTAQNQVYDRVLRHLDRATTQKAFSQDLEQDGIRLYQRGKSLGVQVLKTGKKYRLKTLNLHTAYQIRKAQWEKVLEVTSDSLGKRKELGKNRSRGRGG